MGGGFDGAFLVVGGASPQGGRLTRVDALGADLRWQARPALRVARSAPALALGPDHTLYVFGGRGDTKILAAVERWAPGRREWEALSAMPEGRAEAAAASWQQDLFVLGGFNGRPLRTAWRFTPATSEWRRLPDMPAARTGCVAVAMGERLVVAGGRTPDGLTERVDIFDLQRGEWIPAAPLAAPRAYAAAFAWANQMYVLGGRGVNGPVATVERYNPALNAWTRESDLPVAIEAPVAGVLWQPLAEATLVLSAGTVGGQPNRRTWMRPLTP